MLKVSAACRECLLSNLDDINLQIIFLIQRTSIDSLVSDSKLGFRKRVWRDEQTKVLTGFKSPFFFFSHFVLIHFERKKDLSRRIALLLFGAAIYI